MEATRPGEDAVKASLLANAAPIAGQKSQPCVGISPQGFHLRTRTELNIAPVGLRPAFLDNPVEIGTPSQHVLIVNAVSILVVAQSPFTVSADTEIVNKHSISILPELQKHLQKQRIELERCVSAEVRQLAALGVSIQCRASCRSQDDVVRKLQHLRSQLPRVVSSRHGPTARVSSPAMNKPGDTQNEYSHHPDRSAAATRLG